MKFIPLQKAGAEKLLAMLKGARISFGFSKEA